MSDTPIEWAEKSWNPVTGCTKISEGCRNCYAERMANRLKKMGVAKYAKGFEPAFHPESLTEPGKWKKGRRVFVCSMSDLFQRPVTDGMRDKVFAVMACYPQHTWLLLTKRVKAMGAYMTKAMYDEDCNYEGFYEELGELGIPDADPPMIWTGTSVEDQVSANERIGDLLTIDAERRFVSMEPMLEHITLPQYWLPHIFWVIVGCESGPRRRPCRHDWARAIRDQCVAAGIPFFCKQLAENEDGSGKLIHMPELDGRVWAQVPSPPGSLSR